MKRDELPDLVDEFGRAMEAGFSLADLTAHARSKGVNVDDEAVFDAAVTSDYLFELDSPNDTFVPRRTFFQGAQFRITPLDTEVEDGFLVPGHRFFPFVSREVFPADARLVLPDGSALQTRSVSLPQKQALAFLHFYGSADAMHYLILDRESNAGKLKPPFEAAVELTVFDLRAYFAASGFRSGDSLMLTVIDWLQGVYSVARIGEGVKSVDMAAGRKWMASMQLALDDAMDELGAAGDCYEQLALTMRNARIDSECTPLMKAPPLSLAAYFNSRKDLAVKMVGDRALFWEADGDPREEALLDTLENPSEPESELDACFQDLGLSISEGEAEAYMRDALCQDGGSPDQVLARIVAGRSLYFASAEAQEKFHNLWCALWDEVRQDYSRVDDPFVEVRACFLALNDKAFATIRQLEARGAGMRVASNPVFFEFGQLTAMISSALILFNAPETAQGESTDSLADMLPQLDAALDDLSGRLLQGAAASESGGNIYQLKVSLKGAKPPIWRRILIPADMELEDLHHAVQAVMGWQDCHLYQFKQGRTFFQPDPDDDLFGFDGFDMEDSAGVRIGDLLRNEKDKIVYEYDFGDSWEHEILFEKTLVPEEGQAYPVCIKGKRACPPEDCGGLWGYCNLLEILGDPECGEHGEMLDWVGGTIDPEAFDLGEANARVRLVFG